MARPKKEETSGVSAPEAKAASAESALAFLKKLNPHASFIQDSKLANVNEFINTGNYVLNAMISKDLFGGVPDNKLCLFAGESTTGKTLICLKIAKEAQKRGKTILWFDSEFAITEALLESFGIDKEKFIIVPVRSIEGTRNTTVNFLREIEEKKQFGKYFIFLDSLGNMESELEDARIEDNKTSSDMGTKAKAIGSLLRNLNNWCGFTQTGCVVTNHVYEDTGDIMAKYKHIKPQPGGKKVMFIPSVSVQLTKVHADSEASEKELGGKGKALGQKKYAGQYIRALTVKNRFARPDIECMMYLSQNNGLLPLAGIAELAITLGAIVPEKDGSSVYIIKETGEKIGTIGKWCKNIDILNKLLEPMNKIIKSEWTYGKDDDGILLDGEDLSDEDGSTE